MKNELHLDIEQAHKRMKELEPRRLKRVDLSAKSESELREEGQRRLAMLVPEELAVLRRAAEQSEDKDMREYAQLRLALQSEDSGNPNRKGCPN